MVIALLLLPFALWGVVDMYCGYRMARKPEIDFTNGLLIWWELKWMFASQTKKMARAMPWLSQDLSEQLGVSEDDGEVT